MAGFDRSRLRRWWLLSLLLLLAGCSAAAGGAAATRPPQATRAAALPGDPLPSATGTAAQTSSPADPVVARIDSSISALVEQRRFSGAVLVARDGAVLLSKGYGLADREGQRANTPQTRFRIGSITKQFTALALMSLVSAGKISPQDRVCLLMPDCPAAWQQITLHQLLTHTSGLPNYTALAGFAEIMATPAAPEQLIALFKQRPPDFTPGERWSYSNSGYVLLGALIEQLSGQPYPEFLAATIFKPLGMHDSGYAHSDQPLAVGYASHDLPAQPAEISIAYAAGGLYSTVEDLYRWDRALYTQELLPPELLAQIFAPHATIPAGAVGPDELGYGYGWVVGERLQRRWISHGGRINGFIGKIERYPDQRVAIIVLSNQQDASVETLTASIAELLFA